MPQKFADIRAAFVAREKRVDLVTDGALLAEHEALSGELETAMSQTRTSLADGSSVRDLAAKVEALEARLAECRVSFRLRGLGRNAFQRLLAEHPPTDERSLFNTDTFPPALVAACSLDPVMTAADVVDLGEVLTDGQWDELFDAAWNACREVDGVPFNPLASAVTRD